MSDVFGANMRGAYDLSSLLNRQQPATNGAGGQNTDAQTPTNSQTQPAEPAVIKVASLVVELTEANLRSYLAISQRVPVLVDFYSSGNEASRALSASILGLVEKFGNRLVLGRVDVDQHGRLAEAFNIQQSATLVAVVKGQPLPLTQGDQPAEQIEAIIAKLLLVAEQNGVNGTVEVDENAPAVDTTPKMPPAHQAAVELLNAQKYAEAKAAYEQILRDAPADPLAPAGVAQADLLLRLDGVDVDKVLNTPPQNFEELLQAADALLAIGDYADAFDALLKNYPDADAATQTQMKERMLSYFEIVGKTAPEVVAARATLTSLLF
ncbi:MAG: hypothetical protein RLZZ164_507 [Actinomycetota bacterium]|jgi:putative thioredoxin